MMPADVALKVLAAGRADMEFQTRLPAARHYVENLLAAFNAAVSTGDCAALKDLTQTVAVTLHDGCKQVPGGPEDVIKLLGPAHGKAVHTLTNLSLTTGEGSVHYAATYQIWTLGTARLECTGRGHLHGRLVAGPQVWRWESHSITPLAGNHPSQ